MDRENLEYVRAGCEGHKTPRDDKRYSSSSAGEQAEICIRKIQKGLDNLCQVLLLFCTPDRSESLAEVAAYIKKQAVAGLLGVKNREWRIRELRGSLTYGRHANKGHVHNAGLQSFDCGGTFTSNKRSSPLGMSM